MGVSYLDLVSFKHIPINSENLKCLVLSYNNIAEALPKLNLPNLITLELHSNDLPSIDNITESVLDNLDKLQLKANEITGKLPILKLPKLRVLILSENEL